MLTEIQIMKKEDKNNQKNLINPDKIALNDYEEFG